MSEQIKGEEFLMHGDLFAFTLIVHDLWYDAVWRGGNVVWFFKRITPQTYSPLEAESAQVINEDWTKQTLPKMVYEALDKYEMEHVRK